MTSLNECTKNETVLEGFIGSMKDNIMQLKEVEVDYECLLDTLLYV